MKKNRWLLPAMLLLLVIIYAIDFHIDVRGRDALTWMDPQQYFGFSQSLLEGSRPYNDFEVASIFPFFVVPAVAIDNSVAASLWTNMFFALVLLLAIHLLCRELKLQSPSPLIAAVVLCSPLLIGLSRSLYVEFSLAALVAIGFLLWLKMLRTEQPGYWWGFAACFYLGMLTKMTFPLFFLLPAILCGVGLLARGEVKKTGTLALVLVAPLLAAVGTFWIFFPRAFEKYYLNWANTAMPIVRLIGPSELLSFDSFTYYFLEIVRSLLLLLTPLLLLALFLPKCNIRSLRLSDLAGSRALLWAWLLSPMFCLIPQVVKEPRHLAPCVVPAVLLIFMAIEALQRASLRRAVVAITLLLAVGQYALVTSHAITVPYFLDRPLRIGELQRQLVQSDTNDQAYRFTPGPFIKDHWHFNQSILLAGFGPNEALALSWAAHPAVVIDLETLSDASKVSEDACYSEFNDLSIMTALNTYNRRCGWHEYHTPFSSGRAVANADLLLLKNEAAVNWMQRYPEYREQFVFDLGGEEVLVLRNSRPERRSFRELYARQFLARHPDLSEIDENTVAFDLRLGANLRGDFAAARQVVKQFPALSEPKVRRRRIYYIPGSGDLLHKHVEMQIFRALLSQPPGR